MSDERDLAKVRNAALLLSGLAWLWMFVEGSAGHAHTHALHYRSMLPQVAVNWVIMLAGMMTPVLISPIGHLRACCLARRRARATALFIVAYGAVWTAFAGLLLAVGVGLGVPSIVVVFAAVIWQCSPWKQACLNRCHTVPGLGAFGVRADLDALRYGCEFAFWCAGSCWVWMVLPMLLPSGHSAAMALAAVLMICERLEHPQRQRWRFRFPRNMVRIATALLPVSR